MSYSGEDPSGKPVVVLNKFGRPAPATDLTPEQRERILRQLSVPIEALPQPLFWTAPFVSPPLPDRVAGSLNAAQWRVNRPLNSDEADACALAVAQATRTRGWGVPVWLAATTFFVNRGKHSFQFPFWQPQGVNFNAYAFPHPKKPFLQGLSAVRAWHATRFAAYATILYYFTVPFFGAWGELTASVRWATDARLKQYHEEILKLEGQRKRERSSGLPSARTTPPAQQQQQRDGADTASYDWPSAADMQQQEQQQQPQQPAQPSRQRHQPPSWSQQPQSQSRTKDDDDSFLFDDASPVAPTERKPQPATPSSGTTTWEQLRSRAKTGGNTWAKEDSDGGRPQRGESYTYSESDQEKNYAKEQAQREFDAMLERERSGKGDGNKRW
ncbi:hypothetical protein QBC35DRAFT_130990 [Podospora australis]|uniref:Uncharacterized protein n=1 Tax=Podospora australis TaxID=1536484 RepID=A0AAN7ADZ3_9PEZI|nr:hypothetical protein QBC35DRAFT_130990 [Podospora australis]